MDGFACAISGGKGGVGKTTVAANLGAAVADRGLDVVVVDADLRMANLSAMLGIDHERSVHDVLRGEAAATEAVVDSPLPVLPGDRSLDAFGEADPAELAGVVGELRSAYDVVLVDTGAGVSHEVTVALGQADGVLVVTTPDPAAVEDTGLTVGLTDRAGGTVLGAVLNRAGRPADVSRTRAELPVPLLGVVPEDSPATGDEPLVRHSPESPTAAAFRGLAGALIDVGVDETPAESVETVYEEAWLGGEDEDVDAPEDDDGDAATDTAEDDDGVFDMFN